MLLGESLPCGHSSTKLAQSLGPRQSRAPMPSLPASPPLTHEYCTEARAAHSQAPSNCPFARSRPVLTWLNCRTATQSAETHLGGGGPVAGGPFHDRTATAGRLNSWCVAPHRPRIANQEPQASAVGGGPASGTGAWSAHAARGRTWTRWGTKSGTRAAPEMCRRPQEGV